MKISQREARRLRKRVESLERVIEGQRRSWSAEFPHGVHIATVTVTAADAAAIFTARKLGHAVVLSRSTDTAVLCHALPLGKA